MQKSWSILEHPGSCSVLGAGHYPRTGVWGGGGVLISDFIRLGDMILSRSLKCVLLQYIMNP